MASEKQPILRIVNPNIFYWFLVQSGETTPFQGFSLDWLNLAWSLDLLVQSPSTVVEPSLDLDEALALRAEGILQHRWTPVDLSGLQYVNCTPSAPFHVLFCSSGADARILEWANRQPITPLLVTPGDHRGFLASDNFNRLTLHEHLTAALGKVAAQDPEMNQAAAREGLAIWKALAARRLEMIERDHPCALPNNMVLRSAGHVFSGRATLHRPDEAGYMFAILQSFIAVLELRVAINKSRPDHKFPPPILILSAPAMARALDKVSLAFGPKEQHHLVRKVFRLLQQEKDFGYLATVEATLESEAAMAVARVRGQEIGLHCAAVGLGAVAALAAVLRLRPEVNRVIGSVKQMAQTVNTRKRDRSRTLAHLFHAVQKELVKAVGADFLPAIVAHGGAMKIVADAPIEWLPINDVPLGLRYDCSRISATPGDLMIKELAKNDPIYLWPEDFQEVLVVSSFVSGDPVSQVLSDALKSNNGFFEPNVRVRPVSVSTEEEFINAVNAYSGKMMIFDGHGVHAGTIGHLLLEGDRLSLWHLQSKIRLPPIVILSACDTHAVTESTYTLGNACLFRGARAVVGTLLPIDASSAARFVVHVLTCLSRFVPFAALRKGPPFTWCNLIGIVLRTLAASEFLMHLEQKSDLSKVDQIRLERNVNRLIFQGEINWYEVLVKQLAATMGWSEDAVRGQFLASLPTFNTIRYIHLGNPERIFFSTIDRENVGLQTHRLESVVQ